METYPCRLPLRSWHLSRNLRWPSWVSTTDFSRRHLHLQNRGVWLQRQGRHQCRKQCQCPTLRRARCINICALVYISKSNEDGNEETHNNKHDIIRKKNKADERATYGRTTPFFVKKKQKRKEEITETTIQK